MTSSDDEPSLAPAGANEVPHQDWSLRASGRTYYDRNGETSIILKRLTNSSSSVTGIAGRRGAGKSSLALKVLEECNQQNYFTQLIHSPTSYDPREFLLSVSQQTCDEIVDRLDERRGQLPSLDERAHTEKRRIYRRQYVLGAIAIMLILTAASITAKVADDNYTKNLENRISSLTAQANEIRSSLLPKVNSVLREVKSLDERRFDYSAAISVFERLAETLKDPAARIVDPYEFMASGGSNVEEGVAPFDVLDDVVALASNASEIDKLTNELRWGSPFSALRGYFNSSLIVIPVASIFLFAALLFIFRNLARQLHLIRRAGRKEVGLRAEAVALAEHLSYQTTVSTSQEAGVSLFRLTSAFRRGKSLTTRSLSLPGLTEKFAAFLQKICEVYSDGVVICFDELDKIEDPKELDQLLRGVKGILGRSNTHFLFTVSDDAIARFATRRTEEQGILESAFEDVILLERIDFRFADRMLNPMYEEVGQVDDREQIHLSSKLFWLFGGGVPREIKRNARICLEHDLLLRSSDPTDVWKVLLKKRLEDTRSWVSRVGQDDRITAEFLSSLYDSQRHLMNETTFDRQWFEVMVQLWLKEFAGNVEFCTDNTRQAKEARSKNGGHDEVANIVYGRVTIELVVGATGGLVVSEFGSDECFEKLTPQLYRIFEHAPSNFDFAWKELCKYLKRIQLL